MLDAGSSHTTLYIYKWPAEKENDTGVVNQICECKVKGKMKEKGRGGQWDRKRVWQVEHMKERKSREEHCGAAIVILSSL